MKYKLLLVVTLFIVTIAKAQFSDVNDVVSDFLLISKKYVTPGAEAAIHQSTAGWFRTASPLGPWEIDASVHGNIIYLPEDRKTAQINNSELKNLRLTDGSQTATIATSLGDDRKVFFTGEIFGQEFQLQSLEGLNQDEFIHGFLQASVGLPKNTQLTIRYAPPIPIDDVAYLAYGVGLQHSISQYLNSENRVKLAAEATYSYINFNIAFNPISIPGTTLQSVDITANAFLFQAVASSRFNNLEPVAAFGISRSSFKYQLNGEGETFLNFANDALDGLDETDTVLVGHLGLNVYIGDFSIQAITTFGRFVNGNLGLHYTFN